MPPRLSLARLLPTVALALLAPLGSTARAEEEGRKQDPPVTLPHETYLLANGLRVILHVDRRLPVVATNIWYYVGAKDEPPGRSGFAHLFEHLMFRGTVRVPAGEFDRVMEAEGASNNASTSFDRTNYFCTGPSRLLPTLLWLDADRMEALGPAIAQKTLDVEREVVLNERRQNYEIAPYGRGELAYYEHLYPRGHPHRLGVIGSAEEIQSAALPDVKGFFARFYVPNNACLAVAGDFDPAQVKPLIERLFGSLPRGEDPVRNIVPPVELQGARRAWVEDPQVELARLTLAWHSPAAYTDGDAEMDLIAGVLSQGKTSRLYQRLVYQDRLAADVTVYQQSLSLGSLFRVDLTATPGADLAQLEKAAWEEIRSLTEEGVKPEEVRRVVNAIESSSVASLQSVAAMADRLNAYQFAFGTPDGLERDLNRYRRAASQPALVQEWAARVLRPGRCLTLTVVPPAPPTAGTRDERPPAGTSSPLSIPAPEVFRLPNGLTVWHVERPGLPLASLRLQLAAGSALDPRAKAGLADVAVDMLDEGAGPWDALAFSQALEDLGASLSAGAERDGSALALEVLRRNLAPALELLAAAVTAPRLEPRDWERVQSLAVAALEQQDADPTATARRLGMSAWFGPEHPYGLPSEGRPSTVRALTLEDVKAFHRQHVTPAGAVLLTAGDLSRAELQPLLTKAFEGWKERAPAGAEPARTLPVAAGRGKGLRVLLLDKPGAAQTVIRFVLPGLPYAAPERQALTALNVIFGGSFTSRLNANLREEHGFTYGAGSSFAFQRLDGVFVASSSVQREVTGPALAEFLKEFARLRSGDVSPAEAVKASSTLSHEAVEGLSILGGVLGAYAQAVTHSRPVASVAEDLHLLEQGFPAERLNALAARHIGLQEGVLVLVGDGAAIRAGLKGLSLPEPELVTE